MEIGHNSLGDTFRAYLQRYEALRTEQRALADDVKELSKEIKGAGIDVKTLKTVARLREKDPADVRAERDLLDTYWDFLR